MRDAPDIRMAEETGYPTQSRWPRCPVCGDTCETLYKDQYGEVFGCDQCVETVDAWEAEDE
jgi:hypothetical protein